MTRLFHSADSRSRGVHSRLFRLEVLEDRFLLAVSAGLEFPAEMAAVPVCEADDIVDSVVSLTAFEETEDPLPEFEVTITGYTGVYDASAHGVTLEGIQDGDVVSYSEEGVLYTQTPITYSDAGSHSVYVRVERGGYQTWYGSAGVDISKGQIVISGTTVENKVYDGTTDAEVCIGIISGILEPDQDKVTITATGTFPSSAIGSYNNVKVVYKATGESASNYVISPSFELKSAEITAKITSKIAVSVVLSESLPTDLKLTDLPESLSEAEVGDTVYAQIWVKNVDGSLSGCVGGYLDLVYDDSLVTGETYTVSQNYSNMSNRWIMLEDRATLLGGMCSAGEKTLAVTQWALLGTVTLSVEGAGTAVIQSSTPTKDGKESQALNLARSGSGSFKSSEIDFRSASITITGSAQKLDTPSINIGAASGNLISYGQNRHLLQWTEVENASGYEVAYSGDGGKTWTTVAASENSALITDLTYAVCEQYKVRALGTGLYTDSDWSSVKSFYVCPMDINGDNDISNIDRAYLASCWLSSEGDDEFIQACDINGDGDITNLDRAYLAKNWLCDVVDEAEDMTYPPAAADALFEIGEFFSPLLEEL